MRGTELNLTRWAGATALLGAVVLSGCTCGQQVDACDGLVASVVTPADGAVVSATTTVTAKLLDGSGAAQAVSAAKVETKLSTAAGPFVTGPAATIEGSTITFTGVTLEPGSNQIRVRLTKASCAETVSPTIAVTVNDVVPPTVTACSFPQDTNNDGTLNGTELPAGAKITVQVNSQGAIGGTLELLDASNAPQSATVPVTASSTTAQTTASTFTDGQLTLFARLTKDGVASSTADPKAKCQISVKRAAPACTLNDFAKPVLGDSDDADSMAALFQLPVSGTVDSAMLNPVITLTGGPAPIVKNGLTGTALSVTFDLPKSGSVLYTATLTAADAVGNACSVSKTVTIDYVPPVIVITAPANNATFTSFTVPVAGTATGLADGAQVCFSYVPSAGGASTPAGCATVTNGVIAANFTVTFPNGTWDLTASAPDAAGNIGVTVVRNIVVNSTLCSCAITRPSGNPGFISGSQITGGNYSAQVTSSCLNTAVSFKVDMGTPQNSTTSGAGLASFVVPVTSGSFTFTAEVSNGAQPATVCSKQVTVNTSAPAIVNPTAGTLNALTDNDPATAGWQGRLQYTASVPVGGTLLVCSNQVPAPVGNSGPCPDHPGQVVIGTNPINPTLNFTFPDGSYSIILVTTDSVGAVVDESLPTALVVDTVRPTVVSITLVGDTNGDGNYNLAELTALGGNARFSVTTSGAEDGRPIEVRDELTARTNLKNAATDTVTANAALVNLSQNITTTEDDYRFVVIVTDAAGNTNLTTGATTAPGYNATAFKTVRIDRVPPRCAITGPSAALLGGPDDESTATAGYQLSTRVETSADVGMNGVTFNLTGAASPMQSATPSTSAPYPASFTYTLASAGELAYSLAATCVDKVGNSTPASAFAFTVDNDAPVCAITAPAAGTYTSFSIPTTVTVTGAGMAGRPVTIRSGTVAITPQLTVVGAAASGTVTYPAGAAQSITATASDLAGNTCTSAPVTINVSGNGCSFGITFPASPTAPNCVNSTTATSVAGANVTFNVTGQATNCANKSVVVYRLTPSKTAISAPATTNASGAYSVPVTLAEGAVGPLRVEIDDGLGTINGIDTTAVTVDVTPPTLATTTPAPRLGKVFFVSNTGNPHVGRDTNYVADTLLGLPAEFNVGATGITGAGGGRLYALFNGTEVSSAPIATDAATNITLSNVPLTHANVDASFELRASDACGNEARPLLGTVARVDVLNPGAPAASAAVRANAARIATVDVTIPQTFDDAADSTSGGHAGYVTRWTTALYAANLAPAETGLPETSFMQPDIDAITGVTTTTKVGESVTTLWTAAASQVQALTLPPFNDYYIGVRAKDEVDNYSTYTAPAATLNNAAPTELVNPTAATGQAYGQGISFGALNNDAIPDLVVSAPQITASGGIGGTGVGAVYVFFGGAGFGASTGACTAPACQTIALPSTLAVVTGQRFGNEVVTGNVVDTASEGKPDLVVAAVNTTTLTTGRVFLFPGSATAATLDTTAFVEIRGPATTTQIFGRSVAVIPDIDGAGNPGSTYGELLVGASGENSSRGRVYLFKGRSKTDWDALAGAKAYVDAVTQADAVIDGATGTTLEFSRFQGGFAAIPDLNAVAMPCSRNTCGTVNVFTNAKLKAAVLATPLVAGAAGDTLWTLTDTTTSTNAQGFGSTVLSRDLTTDTGNELLIAQPNQGNVFVYQAPGNTAPTTAILTFKQLTALSSFGNSVAVGSLWNLPSSRPVLAVGEGVLTGGSLWLFHQKGSSFETTANGGLVSATKGFWQSRFTGTAMGRATAIADFNNDGVNDLIAGDTAAASGGKVYVWK